MSKSFSVGLGTFGMNPSQIPDAISSALRLGYRRIDCAPVYFNEDAIGDALHQEFSTGTVNREDLYIVSKLANPFHRKEHVKIGFQKTLTDLRLDYLDLYLIHWPQAFHFVEIDPTRRGYDNEDIDDSDGGSKIDPNVSIHETWAAMEDLVDEGLVREIGVSNFPVSLLHELLTCCRIRPVVNQVEAHPYLQQRKLLAYCQKRGVNFQAYSPLGSPGYKETEEPTLLQEPVLDDIASRHNATIAQICVAWALQRGTSIVVKSATPQRQEENWIGQSIILSTSDMEEIELLERNYRFFRPEDWWGDMAMAVFD
ncbi:aldo-keto oxidoreductase [Nitzschia inconspicua]|uniref:Aldo-keto oxidoreductase n=1 Tax=Nitzschia inconspicua TaxID=303405 RepID=A0A9K3KXU3_9STRA|nr:aldo-keto oxidoreductase [Nitzschia inconspicua]